MSYCGTFSTLDLIPLDLIPLDLILEVISFISFTIRSYSNLPIRSYSFRSNSCLPEESRGDRLLEFCFTKIFIFMDLKRSFCVGTWNIRGIREDGKLPEIEMVLKRRNVDICAFQETKSDEMQTQDLNLYKPIVFRRNNKHHGLALLVKSDLVIESEETICDRIANITVRKRPICI